ncbi:hypothetical protein A2U01_0042224, partial [Trifolium medium]|nr:hypothetical protein [Trifolium medium]
MEGIDHKLCANLWGLDDFEFASKDANGRAGGILMMWDKKAFSLQK